MNFAPETVLSLGGTCQVKAQLGRLGVTSPTSPFDNIVSDFDAVCHVLAERAHGMGSSATASPDLSTCYDDRYGVRLHHDFRSGSQPVDINADSRRYTAERYASRWADFVLGGEAASQALFVRIATYIDRDQLGPFRRQDRCLRANSANRMVAEIERLFPELDFRLLLLVHEDRHPIDPTGFDGRILVETLDTPPLDSPDAWRGLDSAWDALAARHAFPKAPEGYRYWW